MVMRYNDTAHLGVHTGFLDFLHTSRTLRNSLWKNTSRKSPSENYSVKITEMGVNYEDTDGCRNELNQVYGKEWQPDHLSHG